MWAHSFKRIKNHLIFPWLTTRGFIFNAVEAPNYFLRVIWNFPFQVVFHTWTYWLFLSFGGYITTTRNWLIHIDFMLGIGKERFYLAKVVHSVTQLLSKGTLQTLLGLCSVINDGWPQNEVKPKKSGTSGAIHYIIDVLATCSCHSNTISSFLVKYHLKYNQSSSSLKFLNQFDLCKGARNMIC